MRFKDFCVKGMGFFGTKRSIIVKYTINSRRKSLLRNIIKLDRFYKLIVEEIFYG